MGAGGGVGPGQAAATRPTAGEEVAAVSLEARRTGEFSKMTPQPLPQSSQACPRCEYGQLRDTSGDRAACPICAAMTDAEAGRVREAWRTVWEMVAGQTGTDEEGGQG
jgi:hypothetical protein